VEQSLSYIIKVIYFVPLVCHKCAVLLLSETNGRGHDCVVYVGFAVRADMEGEPVGIKAFLDASPNVGNRLST
jgi:hypothetical protein